MLHLLLHASLLASVTLAQGGCSDSTGACGALAQAGHCSTNQLVVQKCPFACGTCTPGTVDKQTPAPTPSPTNSIGAGAGTAGTTGGKVDPNTGCYNTNKDCDAEVLECTNEFNVAKTPLTFNNLKMCIYKKVAQGQANQCCDTYVTVGSQLDPDYKDIQIQLQGLTTIPTPAPVAVVGTPAPVGAADQCTKQLTSTTCLGWGSCEWDYWTRLCSALKFDAAKCLGDNRDCKTELGKCIDSERAAGRTPQIRNLEPCVLMNPQSDCCRHFTNQHLALQGPSRPNRPDRFDLDNCELYKRNNACKNQNHCKWNRARKACEPLRGISAPGLYYNPEMSCGYKDYKLVFKSTHTFAATKRNVRTSCECALFCSNGSYSTWSFKMSSRKCGCTNAPIVKVNRSSPGYYGSATKHAKKRDISS